MAMESIRLWLALTPKNLCYCKKALSFYKRSLNWTLQKTYYKYFVPKKWANIKFFLGKLWHTKVGYQTISFLEIVLHSFDLLGRSFEHVRKSQTRWKIYWEYVRNYVRSESGSVKPNSEDCFWLLLLSNPFAIFTRNNNMFHVKIMAQGFQLLHLLHCESAVGKVLTL